MVNEGGVWLLMVVAIVVGIVSAGGEEVARGCCCGGHTCWSCAIFINLINFYYFIISSCD